MLFFILFFTAFLSFRCMHAGSAPLHFAAVVRGQGRSEDNAEDDNAGDGEGGGKAHALAHLLVVRAGGGPAARAAAAVDERLPHVLRGVDKAVVEPHDGGVEGGERERERGRREEGERQREANSVQGISAVRIS